MLIEQSTLSPNAEEFKPSQVHLSLPPNPNSDREQNPTPPSPQACLFIANISDIWTVESTTKQFETFGEIVSVKIHRDAMNHPYSFVQFADPENSLAAMDAMNLKEIDGRQIRVEQAQVQRTLSIIVSPPIMASHPGPLPNQVMSKISKYGDIEVIKFIITPTTSGKDGQPLQDFSVEFKDVSQNCDTDIVILGTDSPSIVKSINVKFKFRQSAVSCYWELLETRNKSAEDLWDWTVWWDNNARLFKRNAFLRKRAQPHSSKKVLFVGRLNAQLVTREKLFDKFGIGEIKSLELFKTPNKPSFAFIEYVNPEDAIAASKMNGTRWFSGAIFVQLRFHISPPISVTDAASYNKVIINEPYKSPKQDFAHPQTPPGYCWVFGYDNAKSILGNRILI